MIERENLSLVVCKYKKETIIKNVYNFLENKDKIRQSIKYTVCIYRTLQNNFRNANITNQLEITYQSDI